MKKKTITKKKENGHRAIIILLFYYYRYYHSIFFFFAQRQIIISFYLTHFISYYRKQKKINPSLISVYIIISYYSISVYIHYWKKKSPHILLHSIPHISFKLFRFIYFYPQNKNIRHLCCGILSFISGNKKIIYLILYSNLLLSIVLFVSDYMVRLFSTF